MPKICSIDSCSRVVNARGWCSTHYSRWFNTGNPDRACLGCGGSVPDGRTRFCSTDCKPTCVFDACNRSAYASNGLCASHDRQRLQKGELTPLQPRTTQSGGSCVECEAPIPANLKQKYCSDSCKSGASRRRRKGVSVRPKTSACQGCGATVSLTERRTDGKLRRSDGKWCNDCLDQASRRRMYRYGISPERYQAAVAAGCEICGQANPDDLHIDHDHDCCPGQYTCGNCVRGYLCGSCNRAIGLLNNNADRMLAAAMYVMKKNDVLHCSTKGIEV